MSFLFFLKNIFDINATVVAEIKDVMNNSLYRNEKAQLLENQVDQMTSQMCELQSIVDDEYANCGIEDIKMCLSRSNQKPKNRIRVCFFRLDRQHVAHVEG